VRLQGLSNKDEKKVRGLGGKGGGARERGKRRPQKSRKDLPVISSLGEKRNREKTARKLVSKGEAGSPYWVRHRTRKKPGEKKRGR